MREAVILAGGRGTRLQSLVADLPKPMADLVGRPFLEILLSQLMVQGINRCVISVGYLAEAVISHFGTSFRGMEISYVREFTPLGTGGGLRLAMQQCVSEQVFVFNGDTFLDVDVQSVERTWFEHRQPVMVGALVEDTLRYGRISSENGLVTGLLEKGFSGTGIINAGCYLLPVDILNAFQPGTPFSLEQDFLVPCLPSCTFRLLVAEGLFIDIGIPEDYLRAQTVLAEYI